MSYPGYPNYTSYYEGPQNERVTNSYSSGRPNSITSSYPDPVAYSAVSRQSQHVSHGYSWAAGISAQQSHNTNNHDGQRSQNLSRFQDSSQGQSYDQSHSHISNVEMNKRQAEVQAYQNSASRTPAQSSMQALNELAHVSGLESSGLRAGPAPRIRNPARQDRQSQTSISSKAQAAPASSVSYARQNYAGNLHSDHDTPSSHRIGETHSELVLQAAAALQGAANSSRSKMSSPVTNVTWTRPPSQPKAKTLPQNQSSRIRPQDLPYGGTHNNLPAKSGDGQQIGSQQSYDTTPETSNELPHRQVNDVANTAKHDTGQESPTYLSQSDESSKTFINPIEVFNPYHREHERARMEAAAAEASAKRNPVQQAPKPTSTTKAFSTSQQSAVSTAPALSSDKSGSKSKSDLGPVASKSQPVEETDKETELRRMLARMKELRNQDAVLFQKVWDEEKSSKMSGTPAVKLQPPLPATQANLSGESTNKSLKASNSANSSEPRGFNGYPTVIENNPEGLPDLGKFPAARRIRYPQNARRQPTPPGPSPSAQPDKTQAPLNTAITTTDSLTQPVPLVFVADAAGNDTLATATHSQLKKYGSTVWPADRRLAIANSAVTFLLSEPRNQKLTINVAEVLDLLARDPSYVDLCQILEERGFSFLRGGLAQRLIQDVPSLVVAKTRSQQSRAPSRPQVPGLHIDRPSSATFNRPGSNRGPPFTKMNTVKSEKKTPEVVAGVPVTNQQDALPALYNRSSIIASATQPQIAPPAQGSKEDMARKRGFEDLIDLTQEDEDYVVPQKRARLRSPSPDLINSFVRNQEPEQIGAFVKYDGPGAGSNVPNPVTPLRFDVRGAGTLAESSSSRSTKVILAKKLNTADALRRNYYNPKTVARDFLISIGRHPTERPLNAHLAGLLGIHIELESDLSTFHWEDVDPGGPPPPKQPWIDIPAGPPRFKMRHTKSKVDGETIQTAYGQDLDQSRVSATKSSNNGLEKNSPMPRPPQPTPTAQNFDRQAAHRAEESLRNLAAQTKKLVANSVGTQSRQISHSQQKKNGIESISQASQAAQANLPKKRGRPRKTSSFPANASIPLPSPAPVEILSVIKTPGRRQSTASASTQKTPTKLPFSEQLPKGSPSTEAPTMERKRGRPPGSKNKVPREERAKTTDDVQVVISSPQAENDTPIYPIFKCRWVKCGTELHNIPTLRKHIAKSHKPQQDIVDAIGYGCYWKKCSLLRRDEDDNLEPTPIETEQEWLSHINEEHIHPLGRKYGDGPSTSHIGKQKQSFETLVSKFAYMPSPVLPAARIFSHTDPQAVASDRARYLADEQGRTTTHLAHSDDEPDTAILANIHTDNPEHNEAADAAFKAFQKNHNHHKKDFKATADEMLRAMSARKVKAGVGIDRGGCTLVNEERRKTFLHNPGVSRIVDYNY